MGNVTVDASSFYNQDSITILNAEQKKSANEISIEEITSEETTNEEQPTEEPSSEETTTEEITSEEPTSEEPTTEEPTTEPEFIIIDEVYKVKDGVLIEYLGYKDDEMVTELIIPKEIEVIGNNIFLDYKYIKKVTFEEGSLLTEIGEAAFKDCEALSEIELPEGLAKIGYRAFGKCM